MLSEYVLYCVYLCSPKHNSVHIYAANDDAAGPSLDKVANTTAATDEVRSKYGEKDISTGTSEVPYPTTGTYLYKNVHTLSIVLWRVFVMFSLVSCFAGFNCGGLHVVASNVKQC